MMYKPDYKYIPPITWPALTPLYDFFCSLSGLGTGFKEKVLGTILLRDGMTVADIGCGTGVFLRVAKEKYPRVEFIGLDPDQQALAIAERRLARAGIRVEFKEAFAESLPLPDRSIDACFSTLAFHHMPDEVKRKAVAEIYRVLKPDGWVVIADFGKTDSRFLPKFLFFEQFEYLEGNLKGLISQYLSEADFRGVRTEWKKFSAILPVIDIVIGEKP